MEREFETMGLREDGEPTTFETSFEPLLSEVSSNTSSNQAAKASTKKKRRRRRPVIIGKSVSEIESSLSRPTGIDTERPKLPMLPPLQQQKGDKRPKPPSRQLSNELDRVSGIEKSLEERLLAILSDSDASMDNQIRIGGSRHSVASSLSDSVLFNDLLEDDIAGSSGNATLDSSTRRPCRPPSPPCLSTSGASGSQVDRKPRYPTRRASRKVRDRTVLNKTEITSHKRQPLKEEQKSSVESKSFEDSFSHASGYHLREVPSPRDSKPVHIQCNLRDL